MPAPTPELLLVGGGHAHILVLRGLARRPLPGVTVTLVSPQGWADYSGMLPGCVAGHCSEGDLRIDLEPLCRAAGARFVPASAVGLRRASRELLLDDGSALAYGWLSLDIGGAPDWQGVDGAAEHAMAAKPVQGFLRRIEALTRRGASGPGLRSIAVVGGGAVGVELLLALQHRLGADAAERGHAQPAFALFEAGDALLADHGPRTQRRLSAVLRERGVAVRLNTRIARVSTDGLQTDDGQMHAADAVIWAVGARGAAWLAGTGLPLDAQGCVRVGQDLRSLGDPHVFAAGDVAAVRGLRLPRSGVAAVRMGERLEQNLRRAVAGQPLMPYVPQRHWLSLIGTGGRHAVASRGSLCISGGWVWHWKQWLDRRFVARPRTGS